MWTDYFEYVEEKIAPVILGANYRHLILTVTINPEDYAQAIVMKIAGEPLSLMCGYSSLALTPDINDIPDRGVVMYPEFNAYASVDTESAVGCLEKIADGFNAKLHRESALMNYMKISTPINRNPENMLRQRIIRYQVTKEAVPNDHTNP